LKKSALRITAWIITTITTVITISFSLLGQIPDSFKDVLNLIFVLEGTAVINLIFWEISKRLSEPTILMEPIQDGERIGFSVKVKDENIKASVLCDGIPIIWDGTK
jgi:phage-related protein